MTQSQAIKVLLGAVDSPEVKGPLPFPVLSILCDAVKIAQTQVIPELEKVETEAVAAEDITAPAT